jgi:hypothetical protein
MTHTYQNKNFTSNIVKRENTPNGNALQKLLAELEIHGP